MERNEIKSGGTYLYRDVVIKIVEIFANKKVGRNILNHILTMPTFELPETRVLSLEEAIRGNQCLYLESRYTPSNGYVKCDFSKLDNGKGEVVMLFSEKVTYHHQANTYRDSWRLWNRKPTKEESIKEAWLHED